MKYSKYPSYKDSGVEWLEMLPDTWEARRLGFYFSERREKVSDKDYPALSVTKNGIVPQLDNAAKTDDGDNRKKVCEGDFVINSRSDRKGSSGLSELTGSVSLINTIITPKTINGQYTHHLLRSYPFQEEFYRYGKGIVADLWSTNYTSMKNILIPYPPIQEQQTIANYLDKATAKIDTLIEKQTKLIELLREKRQAVISTAVTRGLDNTVAMKDSGVEWLGEIPEGWISTKIKNMLATPITDGPHETPEFLDEGVPFISAEAISKGYINFSKIRGHVSNEANKIYSLKYSPTLHDVYMIKSGATTGVTAIVEDRIDFNIWSPLAVFRSNSKLNPYYLLNYLRSSNFQKAVELYWSYGTQQNIGMNVLENLYISVPPIEEQQVIANYLDDKTSSIDTLITKATKAIDLLKEKRTALISAAVTGKIDIREIA